MVVKGEETLDRFLGRLLAVVNRRVQWAVRQRPDSPRCGQVIVCLDKPGADKFTLGVIHRQGGRAPQCRLQATMERAGNVPVQNRFIKLVGVSSFPRGIQKTLYGACFHSPAFSLGKHSVQISRIWGLGEEQGNLEKMAESSWISGF